MSNLKYSNFAISTLTQELSNSVSEIYLADDALFPDGYFTAVIWSAGAASPMEDSASEIVTMSRISEGVFSATRGEENTSANTWQAGSKIANVVTASTMEYIYAAAGKEASITVMSTSSYEMTRDDTKLMCTFSLNENEKYVKLPNASLCEGLIFTIINRGDETSQRINLYPDYGDTFYHTAESYIRIPSGGTAELTPSAEGWVILGLNNERYGGIKFVSTDMPDISFGDGVIYASTFYGNINISLPTLKDYCGTPLTIFKYSDDSNIVSITGYAGDTPQIELTNHFESATFVMEQNGTIRLINQPSAAVETSSPSSNEVIFINSNTFLTGSERFVFITAEESNVYAYLPEPSGFTGHMVTIKKIDDGAGAARADAVNSKIDGTDGYMGVSGQWEFMTFASSGDCWYRVG